MKIGVKIGPTIGVSPGFGSGGPLDAVPRDATSLVYRPSTLAQWQAVLNVAGDALGDPFMSWNLNQASGNATDQIGAFTGTLGGTILNIAFRQAVPGWSAVGLQMTKDTDCTIFNASASLPDISTGDLLVMGTAFVPNPGPATTPTTAVHLGVGFGTDATLQMDTTPRIKAVTTAATTNGTANPLGIVTPFAVLVDRTNTRCAMLTKQEALAVAIGGAGKQIVLGGNNIETWLSAGWTYLDLVAFQGAAARKTNNQIKTIWQTLGHTVAW